MDIVDERCLDFGEDERFVHVNVPAELVVGRTGDKSIWVVREIGSLRGQGDVRFEDLETGEVLSKLSLGDC